MNHITFCAGLQFLGVEQETRLIVITAEQFRGKPDDPPIEERYPSTLWLGVNITVANEAARDQWIWLKRFLMRTKHILEAADLSAQDSKEYNDLLLWITTQLDFLQIP